MNFIDFEHKTLKNWLFNAKLCIFKVENGLSMKISLKIQRFIRIWKYWWNFCDRDILLRVLRPALSDSTFLMVFHTTSDGREKDLERFICPRGIRSLLSRQWILDYDHSCVKQLKPMIPFFKVTLMRLVSIIRRVTSAFTANNKRTGWLGDGWEDSLFVRLSVCLTVCLGV